jgi:hypothetical protein
VESTALTALYFFPDNQTNRNENTESEGEIYDSIWDLEVECEQIEQDNVPLSSFKFR